MACIEYPLCQYARYGEGGLLYCQDNCPCTFQRYCSSLLKNIHTSAYKSCKEASILSGKKKNFIQVIDEEKKKQSSDDIIEKSEVCKAHFDNGLMYIDFKGYGLIASTTKKSGSGEVTVYYRGEIGTPTFKFRV